MVFPHNKFSVTFLNFPGWFFKCFLCVNFDILGAYIEFNAFDALQKVISDRLPDVQVLHSFIFFTRVTIRLHHLLFGKLREQEWATVMAILLIGHTLLIIVEL